jgi:hypothetical protein
VVYARKLGSKTYTFQVSGKLWRNSLIMQDRETESAWSHVTGRAIEGKATGAQLVRLDAVQTVWKKWVEAHPDTTVLTKSEEISGSHYKSYFEDPERMGLFRAQWLTERMPGKTLVFGTTVGPHAVAVTEDAVSGGRPVQVDLGGTNVVVAQGADGGVRAFVAQTGGNDIELVFDSKSGEVRDESGSIWNLSDGRCIAGPKKGQKLEAVAVTPVYWFAWSNFYPNTQVVDQR